MQTPETILPIIEKYLAGTATPEEEKLINEWYHSFADEQPVIEAGENDSEELITRRIKDRLRQTLRSNSKVIKLSARKWAVPAAAAIIFILISAGAWFFLLPGSKTEIAQAAPSVQKHIDVIVPGGEKAVLTLADGSTIILDSASNGLLSRQGNTNVIKLDGGQLAYNSSTTNVTSAILYNTIATPRGGQYQVTLPDGSNVWLNAASSLRFPTAFTGTERRVEITGEAYFEIAHNKAMPFIVKVNETVINVLGTHFNVMAYENEATLKTTLLEGSLRVSNGSASDLLKPGQQAQQSKNGVTRIIDHADTEEAVAWKNGRFQFKSADIKTIMRQIERWYDIDVSFTGNVALHFSGQIPRKENVAKLFKTLALTNEVKFKIEGRRVTVFSN